MYQKFTQILIGAPIRMITSVSDNSNININHLSPLLSYLVKTGV